VTAPAAASLELVERYVYDVVETSEVKDGDTYVQLLEREIGFHQVWRGRMEIRLDYADTPEKSKGSPHERSVAKQAQAVAAEWLRSGQRLNVRTRKPRPDRPPLPDGGFGRWLGDIWDADSGEHLADHLRRLGLASVWPTRWRDEFDQEPQP